MPGASSLGEQQPELGELRPRLAAGPSAADQAAPRWCPWRLRLGVYTETEAQSVTQRVTHRVMREVTHIAPRWLWATLGLGPGLP